MYALKRYMFLEYMYVYVSCLLCMTLRDLRDCRVAWYRKSSASFSIPY